MPQETWLSCLRRRGLGEIKLRVECPAPCESCFDDLPCEQQLKHYRSVYRKLLTEKRAVAVSDGFSSVTYDYSPQIIAMINDEIKRLNLECGAGCTQKRTRPGPIRLGIGYSQPDTRCS